MHPQSRLLISQILAPSGHARPPAREPAPTPMTIEQIIRPTGVYEGPERRTLGVLVAEPLDGRVPAAPELEE